MKILESPLWQLPWYEEALKTIEKEHCCVRISGCEDSQKLHLVSCFGDHVGTNVIVTYSENKARSYYEEYSFYDKNVYYYPAKDLIFYQSDVNGNQVSVDRMRVLHEILEKGNITVITTIDAFAEPMLPAEVIKDNVFSVRKGSIVDERAIVIKLTNMGYERCTCQVEKPGQFAVRGGIIDVYNLTADNPVRVELWGDEVESIRAFDVMTQKSIENLQEITVFPASELIMTEEIRDRGYACIEKEADELRTKYKESFLTEEAHRIKMLKEEVHTQLYESDMKVNLESYIGYFYPKKGSLLDMFGRDTCFYLDDAGRIREHMEAVTTEFTESMSHRLEKGYVLPGQIGILDSFEKVMAGMLKRRVVLLEALNNTGDEDICKPEADYQLKARMLPSFNGSFKTLVDNLKTLKKKGERVVIVSPSRTRAARLAEDITNEGVIVSYTEDKEKVLQKGEFVSFYGRVSKGFEYPDIEFTIISEMDIFGAEKKKKKRRPKYSGGTHVSSLDQLNVGDYVIHENYGVGVYKGIEKIPAQNVLKDYMKIEYKDGGNLYVLATNLDMIQFYAQAAIEKKPKLNKLGTQEWSKTKAKVQTQIKDVAKELVHLYAVRSTKIGYQYGRDTVWQKEFEEIFPFDETEDQLSAIEATKADMESTRIMDRLICGDVGFGKTEVAIRAAFKAVQDGKQVAYLVPTTILAQQHYNTFAERMKDYPIRVEMLSRFKTPSQVKAILTDVKKGLVDIVIGTHRLLSKDVEFSSLGLLVVDEEQRFGVSHKERIKEMKQNVDVLTLTATPIPRTLHMSLVGIRDMSLLEEAPLERQPIQTFVMEYNAEMVREAINREMARGGQVYYVYNRVEGIAEVASEIASLVPEANVAFAHGQMKERELEDIMLRFINNEIDVLVSTTIIETGLDIPNVNTMIIQDSDNLGLSQLYQLRGRVGRSNRTSYAFLMYRRNKVLREVAEKRLMAIREFTELGSGFKIAMRDLEIRGAGTLLGHKQHGHIEAVGYELYCKMLEAAVKEEQGIFQKSEFCALVDLDVDAFIPETYIVNEVQKLDIYKRIACLKDAQDVDDMRDELRDRFGKVPKEAENLLRISLIKQRATELNISDIRGRVTRITVTMPKTAPVNASRVPFLLNEYAGDLRLKTIGDPQFTLIYDSDGLKEKDEELLLIKTEELLDKMKMLYEE